MKTGIFNVFQRLFKLNSVSHLFHDFKYELSSHPDYPSLKSISDTLEKFGFENVPVKLKAEELNKLEDPFLTYVKNKGQNELALVKPLKTTGFELFSEQGETTNLIEPELSSQFTGVVVLLELQKSKTLEPNMVRMTNRKIHKTLIGLTIFSLLIFFIHNLVQSFDLIISEPHSIALMITKSLGLLFAYAIVSKDLGTSSSVTNKVCKIGGKADCNTVLESKYATVVGWVKWSDLGFVYFLSSLLLVSMFNTGAVIYIALAALPYVFVSLYQQIFLVKKFCPLCLGVVTLLIAESIIGIISLTGFDFSINQLLESTLLLLSVSTVYLALKSLILTKRTKSALKFRYNRLKRIPEVVSTVVKRERPLILPEGVPLNNLSFGSQEEGVLHIQSFLSLHCGHCGSIFNELNTFLEKNRKVRIDLFLTFNPKDSGHLKVMEEILQAYHKEESGKAWGIVGDWYAKPLVNKNSNVTYEPTEALKKLFFTTKYLMQVNQIFSLPLLFIEGFEKSSHYKLGEYLVHSGRLKGLNIKNQREMIINT